MKPETFNSRKAIFPLIFIFSAIFFIVACSKSNNNPPVTTTTTGTAFVSVVDASPTTATYSVYSDTTNISTAGTLSYGSATGVAGGNPYASIVPGTHSIKLLTGGNTIFIDSNASFANGDYYSFFVYDTGQVKTLALTDNLTAPASNSAEVRFLNLSPNSQMLNVWLINKDSTTNDSTSFLSNAYIGSATVSSDSLSSFKTIPAGTYKVLFNSSTELSLFENDSLTFAGGKIYTLYAKGYQSSVNPTDSLGLGVIQNN